MYNPLNSASSALRVIENCTEEKYFLRSFHPQVKVLVTIAYLLILMSIPKHDVVKTLCGALYAAVLLPTVRIPLKNLIKILAPLCLFFALFGIINIFFDTQTISVFLFGTMTGGTASCITIVSKGVFAFFAAFLLILSTSVEEICAALRSFKVPNIICTQILLMYRYLHSILIEASRMYDSYTLRAPRQKGIALSAWGSFIGQLLLRSIDKAENVYQSMLLRGFNGSFYTENGGKWKISSYIYMFSWMTIFILWKII